MLKDDERKANLNLKSTIKDCAGLALRLIGAEAVTRALLHRNRCGILLYHDPAPDVLDRHLEHLKKKYSFITLDELWSTIVSKRARSSGPTLTITFDDGHAGNFRLINVFKKHQVRPTIFICSSIVGTRRMFWWQHPGAKKFEVEALKRLPTKERLAQLQQVCFRNEAEASTRMALSLEQLSTLRLVADIQSHTRFHPILTQCDDEECWEEIAESKREVEQLTGLACEHFSYPNGNYDARTIHLVKEAGYRSARTCDLGWNDQGTSPFQLKIIPVDDYASLSYLDAQLTGITTFLRYAKEGSFNGQFPQF